MYIYICEFIIYCEYSSGVERDLAKVDVARSNRVTRFFFIFIKKKMDIKILF